MSDYIAAPRVITNLLSATVRRDTNDRWAEVDPILDDYEIAWEKDTDRFKVGDGKLRWSELPYYTKGEQK